jgi:hypothetical protein
VIAWPSSIAVMSSNLITTLIASGHQPFAARLDPPGADLDALTCPPAIGSAAGCVERTRSRASGWQRFYGIYLLLCPAENPRQSCCQRSGCDQDLDSVPQSQSGAPHVSSQRCHEPQGGSIRPETMRMRRSACPTTGQRLP